MYLKTIRNVVKNCGFQRKIQLQILTAERHQQSTYSSYSTTISLWLLMPNSTTNSTKWLQISRADFCSRHGTAWEPLAVSCWSHWTCVLLAFCLSRWFISDTTWFQGSWRVLSGLDRCTFRMHTTETLGTDRSFQTRSYTSTAAVSQCSLMPGCRSLPAAAFKLRIQEPVREGTSNVIVIEI